MLNITIKKFDELTLHELYEILQLRSEVFVVEQDCVYQDVDGKDAKALHIIGKKERKIIAYTRLFNTGDYFNKASLGRVVVKQTERKFGYGHDMMRAAIKAIKDYYNQTTIKISAQKYLKKFYEAHAFVQQGTEYLEDGLPHIAMVYNKT